MLCQKLPASWITIQGFPAFLSRTKSIPTNAILELNIFLKILHRVLRTNF